MKLLQNLLLDTKLLVHLLVILFAISSWVDINGLWVELPILVTNLPEEWTLPSYITILSQIANLGPLTFLILTYLVSKTYLPRLIKITSYAIMGVGLASTILLAFFWQKTLYVAGSERSVSLLALSFCLAFMDCTSSLAYVAFMAALKPAYMTSFFVGEGLSGLIPALMALGQGAGEIICINGSSTSEKNVSGSGMINVTEYFVYPNYKPPRFSIQLFFFLLAIMICLSVVAFMAINVWSYCTDAFVETSSYVVKNDVSADKETHIGNTTSCSDSVDGDSPVSLSSSSQIFQVSANKNDSVYKSKDSLSQRSGKARLISQNSIFDQKSSESTAGEGTELLKSARDSNLPFPIIVWLQLQVFAINFIVNGLLPSIQIYSSLPYGISVYSLVVTLSSIANPLACIIAVFVSVMSTVPITVLTSLGLGCAAYILFLAAVSPTPPLLDNAAGGPVSILIWVGASFFLTYGKISVAAVMRSVSQRALIWYGVITQAGSLIGAIVGFVLVNQLKVFKDASWC